MMPKVTLLAPDGVRGQIHASQSGKNYDIDEDGKVVVDNIDVTALLTGGYTHVHRHRSEIDRAPDAPPISSVATHSHEVGATAIDPAKRQALHRPGEFETRQQSEDNGGAKAPHGDPAAKLSTEASRAEAQEEVDQAERDGADAEHRSHIADTGHMDGERPNADDQASARGEKLPSDVHDGTYQNNFKDHAGQEGGDKPTIRGKTQAEVDGAK